MKTMDRIDRLEVVAMITEMLPRGDYCFCFDQSNNKGQWHQLFDDKTAAWLLLDMASGEIELATSDYTTDSGKCLHRDIENLPEMAVICLRFTQYGHKVKVNGSEYCSTPENRAELKSEEEARRAAYEKQKSINGESL